MDLEVENYYLDKNNNKIKIIDVERILGKRGRYFSDIGIIYNFDGSTSNNTLEDYNIVKEFNPLSEEMNPNRNKEYRLSKMIRNYQKFGNIVVGVDFDFTLVDAVTNEIYADTIELLKRCQREEIVLCIWTANTDREYVESIWYSNNLNFSYYNYSPINPSSLKPHFNILLDDSAGLNESMELLQEFLDYLDYPKV